jgi:GPI ethanolamine phosphate transferase 1
LVIPQIIKGDGLRADKAFRPGVAKHLRFAAGMRGAYGVSHTRVPTESRPGHVAIFAGFYEDVSAVAKGWAENPVEFDHIFKRAKFSFIMGAPEIMHLFKKNEEGKDSIWSDSFDPALVDFGIKDATIQDKWSFDRFDTLLKQSKSNSVLERRLKSEKVVIFLHLLGHDTNGHAYGPKSIEYRKNTEYVDGKIKEMEEKVNSFFEDEETAWIFTADHGMTDGRSHGDGDPQNTRTPLIAWGKGIREPIYRFDKDPNGHDSYSEGWGMNAKRVDISQADITPLIASLVGIPIPVNSEGVLPIDYLNMSQEEKSQMLLWNLKQLNENYRIKEGIKIINLNFRKT